jgi:dynein heavy chain 2
MADRNVPSLVIVYRKAEDLFRRLLDEKNPFIDWVALGSVNLDQYVEENLHEVADYETNFKMLKSRGREAEKLPYEKKVDCISLSFGPVKASVDDLMQRLADSLVSSLRKMAVMHINQLEEFCASSTDKLNTRPNTVEEIGLATTNYKKINDDKPAMRTFMTKVETINKLLRTVIGVGLNLTGLQSKWESLEIALEYHEVMVKEQLERMKVTQPCILH